MRVRRALTTIVATLASAFLAASPAIASDAGGIPIGESGPSSALLSKTVTDDSVIQSRDAIGCTWAPGPAGSTVCLTVNNPTPAGGVVLDRLQMTYTAPSTNICATTFEVRYETRTASPVHYRRGTATGCAPLTRGWVWDPNPNITLQHGSQVCGRAKNAVTGNAWTHGPA